MEESMSLDERSMQILKEWREKIFQYKLSSHQKELLDIMHSNWRNAKRQHGLEENPNSFIGLPREKSSTPIVGWRTWKVVPMFDLAGTLTTFGLTRSTTPSNVKPKNYLAAAHVNIIWESPVMTTNVLPNGRLAEVSLDNKAVTGSESRGDYGIYSYKTLRYLLHLHGVFHGVLGKIECYGQVIEHEFGYRAQKAIIKELFINHEFGIDSIDHNFARVNAKKDFEEIYQCPVTIIRSVHWEDFVKEHRDNV